MTRSRIFISFACVAISCTQGRDAAVPQRNTFDPKVRADPVRLVREYVERDARGDRLETNAWFDSVVTWPQDPGYDSYAVITRFGLSVLGEARDTTRVEVQYDVAGIMKAGGPADTRFAPRQRTEVDTFVVERAPDGWRISSPQIHQHVLAAAALQRSALGKEDRDRLTELRRQR